MIITTKDDRTLVFFVDVVTESGGLETPSKNGFCGLTSFTVRHRMVLIKVNLKTGLNENVSAVRGED
jgi:hypothetical protein